MGVQNRFLKTSIGKKMQHQNNSSFAGNQTVKNNPALYELVPQKSGNKFSIKLNLPSLDTRYIGYIEGDTYIKNVNLSRHKFNKNNSIAFCLSLLENEKFIWIKVICDDGRILETSRKYVLIHGIRKTFKGWEAQLFLSLHLFSRQEALKFECIEEMKPVLTQMNLFS
jgi:hypothetical protein